MNEIEFAQWVQTADEGMRHIEGGILYMTNALTERERELAEAELTRRRGVRCTVIRHAGMSGILGIPHRILVEEK